MDFLPGSTDHLCYVRCNFCDTLLAVGVPCRRLMDTVTVKCGHCSHLSFLSARPLLQNQSLELLSTQNFCGDNKKSQQSSSSSPLTPNQQVVPKVPNVVKPPEKKHRLPSAYNRFMKEEIKRIKAGNPEIPHREAFSMAAKNWARFDPQLLHGSTTSTQIEKQVKPNQEIHGLNGAGDGDRWGKGQTRGHEAIASCC
ncbi:protein CRABS CLAW isoform X1 [Amborella trichopoda]|uniref:protein CRABS CLAW isoform X1 n=1 Tax=Amborella trichopoda TaxID=13333 RepID=UPI0009BD5B27|nr:protein CRABS CLAW isoform X1 [Amborella trichopoda]|eukprot:XP_020530392.1 protein CRABS CLAW isoform X1 [Amborella trichopoda]